MNTLAFLSSAILAASAPAQVISEQELIAAVLVGEAGSNSNERGWEPYRNMQAVLEVIWQRHFERKQTFLEVLTERKQFSCLNGTTPQALIAKSKKHRNWLSAYYLADSMPKTRLAKGANHFCKTNIHPRWARGKRPVAIIGRHKFYRIENNKQERPK